MNQIVENVYTHKIAEDLESAMWKQHARADRKVEAIKAFRANTGSGLLEAKQVVEHYTYLQDTRNTVSGVENPRKTRIIELRNTRIVVTEKVPGFYNIKEVTDRNLGVVGEDELLQFLANHVISNGYGSPQA